MAKIVVPVPARTVDVAGGPGLTGGEGTYGEEVYAGPDTSCPFALNVGLVAVGASAFYAYSPVTGSTYLMTSSESGGLCSHGRRQRARRVHSLTRMNKRERST